MPLTSLPEYPYGAVYFRKSNPPQSDWARDYATAAEDGMNLFRHWFLWSAIETAPGVFDWSDYDQQLDLAAQHGIKTIIAEMLIAAPEWIYRVFAGACFETAAGQKINSSYSASCAVGGFPGLCLDHVGFRAAAEGFLRALVTRYKGHPGLAGYDIWNECNYPGSACYCPATQEEFRGWLKAKYGDLPTLAQTWRRYSLAEWIDVTAPRDHGPNPDTLDWLQFHIDHHNSQMRWRADLIRSLDPDCAIVAHGTASSQHSLPFNAMDDWSAAAPVEVYGVTWGSCRHGDEPWQQVHAMDLTRAAARGKPFWHAEHYGGPLWMQPQVISKPRSEGRIPSPEDIRYWSLVSLMTGAAGMMYLRWRPLLDGALFGAFGPYGMDGSRTPRSEMVTRLGRWLHDSAQVALLQAKPVPGDIGILFLPETQLFTYAQQGNTAFFTRSLQGAYRGFFDNNIQPDWVHLDDIAPHRLLYLPFPYMLSRQTADRLRTWVEQGGTLISEGCPAYFGDAGHAGVTQPNFDLDALFGARESWVEFTPDLLEDLRLTVGGLPAWGGIFMQAYQPTTGKAVGWYADGQVAAVEHTFGQGRTLLIGTMTGAGHAAHSATAQPPISAPFFTSLLEWAGVQPALRCSDSRLIARLTTTGDHTFLWVANPTRQEIPAQVELSPAWGLYNSARTQWGARAICFRRTISLTALARDVTILALEP